ncbi:transporter substrate-binding domain-containing protein [Roseibium algae]|uniref:Transporter substrate-binding domain-containing protein n=1 Tax=Roseibium algae TaxID=3123038 RepID=A0ABU8TGV1_9HYPH
MKAILAIVYISILLLLIVAHIFPSVHAQANQDKPVIPVFGDPKGIQDRPESFPEKIQFLATDAYPPFVFRDATGRLTGFNVDLSRAICLELGSSCSLRIKEFDALVPALEEGEGDAIISGLGPSTALSDTVQFSPDYLKLPARFIVRRDGASTFDENALAGVRISVAAGSRHEAFALKFFPSALLQSYQTATEARKAVKDGTADAHFGDGLSLAFWLNSETSQDCCSFSGGPWLEPGYFDTGLSIAVRKQDIERAEAIEYALRLLVQKGTFRELYLRYFPLSFY